MVDNTRLVVTLWCSILLLLGMPVQARHVPALRSLQQLSQPNALEQGDSSWVAHECLWTNWTRPAAANQPDAATTSASASANATAAGTATASASASASATASASASASAVAIATLSATESALQVAEYEVPTASTAEGQATPAADTNTTTVESSSRSESKVACSLNPSYLFSLPTPNLDSEKLLLEITAMRYGCVNHTNFSTCAADQSNLTSLNWCTWHEEAGRCGMYYDDADFVHLMLWSGTKVACAGSKVAAIVACSYGSSLEECGGLAGCTWSEGTCYPDFYAPLISKPKSLAAFKRQVHTADPAVWGSCAGADLYRSYSSICNHGTEACKRDSNCHYINEYDIEVANNPLNFSKPCLLSTTRFPIESVFLQVNSNFSAAVFGAQKECIMASDQANCTERKANISSSALQDSMQYMASKAPAQPPNKVAAAVAKPQPGDGSNAFVVASWEQMGPTALLQLENVAGEGAQKGGSSANAAVNPVSNLLTSKGAQEITAASSVKGEGQLEGGPAAESPTSSGVTAPLAAASQKKILRESAIQPALMRASRAGNLPPPLSVLASLALPRALPSVPVPPASGPLAVPQTAASLLPVPKLPLFNSNGTGSCCTTIATCRAAFVSLKKLRVIVDMAPTLPLESQSVDLVPASWQLDVPRP